MNKHPNIPHLKALVLAHLAKHGPQSINDGVWPTLAEFHADYPADYRTLRDYAISELIEAGFVVRSEDRVFLTRHLPSITLPATIDLESAIRIAGFMNSLHDDAPFDAFHLNERDFAHLAEVSFKLLDHVQALESQVHELNEKLRIAKRKLP